MFSEIKKQINIKSTLFQYMCVLSVFMVISIVELMVTDDTAGLSPVVNSVILYLSSLSLFLVSIHTLRFTAVNYLNYSITAIIIYLLIHPSTTLWLFPLTIICAVIGKYVFRYRSQPVFNPAALGLFAAYYISVLLQKTGLLKETLFVSWWGAELNRTSYSNNALLYSIPLILGGLLVYYAYKYKKLLHGTTFFVTYILISTLYSVMHGDSSATILSFISFNLFSSYAFLSFVMVTEPKTSPIIKKQQIVLGILGGVLLFVFTIYLPSIKVVVEVPDITALLVLNLFTFVFKQKRFFEEPIMPS